MERKPKEEDLDNEMADASAPKFRPFKSNLKSKNLPPPAAAFAKATENEEEDEEDDYMSNDILKEM